MNVLDRLTGRVTVLRGLMRYLWEQRLWWMIPMIFVLVVMGLLIVFAQSSSVAPFIYVLF